MVYTPSAQFMAEYDDQPVIVPTDEGSGVAGSVARVRVLGWTQQDHDVGMLNISGPTSAIETVAAMFKSSRVTNTIDLYPTRGTRFMLYKRNDVRFHFFRQKLESIGHINMLIISDLFLRNQEGIPYAYAAANNYHDLVANCGTRIYDSLDIPILDDWYSYLFYEGRGTGLISKMRGYGMTIWRITLDDLKWIEIITTGLRRNHITFPLE